jgi:hypothetical protein
VLVSELSVAGGLVDPSAEPVGSGARVFLVLVSVFCGTGGCVHLAV